VCLCCCMKCRFVAVAARRAARTAAAAGAAGRPGMPRIEVGGGAVCVGRKSGQARVLPVGRAGAAGMRTAVRGSRQARKGARDSAGRQENRRQTRI